MFFRKRATLSPCHLVTLLPCHLVTLSALLLAIALPANLVAQEKTKQPIKKEEEEDPGAKPKRPVPLVGDEEKEEKASSTRGKAPSAPVTDLDQEAERTRSPIVKELFSSLANPFDVITTRSGREWRVLPISEYIGSDVRSGGSISVQIMRDKNKPVAQTFSRTEIQKVDPYEIIALNKVNEFLKNSQENGADPGPRYMARVEVLQNAEKALAFALRFHDSARERQLRKGPGWPEVENTLRERLRDVQLDQLHAYTEGKDWDQAFALATTLAERYRRDEKARHTVAELLAQHAEQSLKSEDYRQTNIRLLLFEKYFPDSTAIEPVREGLRKKARELLDSARQHEANGDAQGARTLLETAKSICPQLEGLHDYSLQLGQKYPILYVGVQDLPANMSPARAWTDAEKQAVELQFESMIRVVSGGAEGEHYEFGLAADLPELTPLGRRFQLVRNAHWSNGRPLMGTDVRHTVELLSDRHYAGRIPEWAELIPAKRARVERDQTQITLTMWQGYLDPLALMDFKILPEWLLRADDADFAQHPIGSGAYMLDRNKKSGEEVVFVANPYYSSRPGKLGLPHIREIHFRVSSDPVGDFHLGRLHLLLDLSTHKYHDLQTAFQGLSDVQVQTVPNRRVYFLAVNHRRAPLKSTALRRAIAHGIDRENILNEKFRYGFATYHRVLNGPYPPSSWAYSNKSELKTDPYDLALARSQAEIAKKERATFGKLTLKYPDGDPDVRQACEFIKAQLSLVNIDLELVARSPRDLHADVEETHDYDLAYYHWDYPDESYWLWPLFDPNAAGAGGPNFLGYQNDDVLAHLFRTAMTRREFKTIQDVTHQIHELLYEKMPLIPLWQLDTHYAIHNTLNTTARIDPLLIFTDADRWSLGNS